MCGCGLCHSGGRSREKRRRGHLDAPVLKEFAEVLNPFLNVITDCGASYTKPTGYGLVSLALKKVGDNHTALLSWQVLNGFIHESLDVLPSRLRGLMEFLCELLFASASAGFGFEEVPRTMRGQPVQPASHGGTNLAGVLGEYDEAFLRDILY